MSTLAKTQFPSWPFIASDEIAAVTEVLSSGKINYWTGPHGKVFEQEFANYMGCEYGIALANGTLALELALRVLDIGPGDEVIVPAKTFIATASAVVMCGAIPVVADIELDTQNISANTIAPLLSAKTKAIIVVHLGGLACDMDPILELAKASGLRVIEDCAQAHGARYKGKLVGSFGDISCFSFCQDKIITTGGEGGMFLTNNEQIWQRAWAYKDHGKDYAAVCAARASDVAPGFKWLHHSFGSNYRLTEMQAVLGIVQLSKLQDWLQIRRRNAQFLLQAMQNIPGVSLYNPGSDYLHAYYKFYWHLDPESLSANWSKVKVLAALQSMGIPCAEGSCSEIYREQAFIGCDLALAASLPNAQRLSATSMVLEVHPCLDLEHMQSMLQAVQHVLAQARG